MILAFDAGAFQQRIAGGILNVAVNFLNAAAANDKAFNVILLADPFFGEARPEFLAKLNFKPKIVYESVLRPTQGLNSLVTYDPGIQVLVDGVLAPFTFDGDAILYKGPAPKRAFEIRSRSARPCDVFEGATDERTVGLSFSRVEIEDDERAEILWADDPRFDTGNNGSEITSRWTAGSLKLPSEVLPASSCKIRIHLVHKMVYPLGEGRYNHEIGRIQHLTNLKTWRQRLLGLGAKLKAQGAEAYMANHFLPVQIPGLKLFTWAYDIIPVTHPQFFNPDAIQNFNNVVSVMRQADAIFCISKYTHDQIEKHLALGAARLYTSWIGAGPNFYRRSESEVSNLKNNLNIKRPYMLCVATIEPRKNHVALIKAYADLVSRHSDAPDLIVAGARGWGYDAFFEEIKRSKLESRVKHFEHLTDDEISSLYSGAELVIYPSLFEGFGLPVLEAMKCGVPVVTSRGTSMEDIAKDCSVLIDPLNPKSISFGIEMLLHDAGLRAHILQKAEERLPQFEWRAIVRNITREMQSILR